MPGKIIAVDVSPGDSVTKGQRLLTLEAMKMEHTLTAPFDGLVAALNASPGAQVQAEALLPRIETAECANPSCAMQRGRLCPTTPRYLPVTPSAPTGRQHQTDKTH